MQGHMKKPGTQFSFSMTLKGPGKHFTDSTHPLFPPHQTPGFWEQSLQRRSPPPLELHLKCSLSANLQKSTKPQLFTKTFNPE